MKLKQLGLIFKAPTKRSNASAANKRLWRPEQDDQLKDLYDKYRLEENTLERIMDTFSLYKSKNMVVKRMLQLGLIAEKSEIVPRKPRGPRTKKKSGVASDDESDSDSSDDDQRQNVGKKTSSGQKNKPKQNRVTLDVASAKRLLSEIEDSQREAIEWLIESFSDAMEDMEYPLDDDDETGVPIVPVMDNQIQAINNDEFKRLMESLGLNSPDDMMSYWRIPKAMSSDDLKKRIAILKGEEVASNNEGKKKTNNHDDDSDDAENMFGAWRVKANNLIYHESDNEDRFDELRASQASKKQKSPKKKRINKKSKHSSTVNIDMDNDAGESEPESNFMLSTQQIHSRLNELMTSSDESQQEAETVSNTQNKSISSKAATNTKHKRITLIDSSDSEESISIAFTTKQQHVENYDENDEEKNNVHDKSTSNLVISSNPSNNQDNNSQSTIKQKNNKKRDRSEESTHTSITGDNDDDNDSDEDIRRVHKKAKSKRMVLSDDENDMD